MPEIKRAIYYNGRNCDVVIAAIYGPEVAFNSECHSTDSPLVHGRPMVAGEYAVLDRDGCWSIMSPDELDLAGGVKYV